MRELLYIPFYLLYVGEWLWHLLGNRGNTFKAYESISFEKEAYRHQSVGGYIATRRVFAQWRKYN